VGWPSDWEQRVAGTACALCTQSRTDESEAGLRILGTELTDAYLMRRALVRGYVVVIWRGRHVVEPYQLGDDEAARYQADVHRVARAMATHFRPMKMNCQTLGNRVPHLHTHLTPRYRDDPAPGAPLPDGPNLPLPERQWRADATALRRLLGAEPR
jgi:diadenosine tetraphosphate (Ap4A) HIT family hydrolase